jgi:hypothetical protein
LAVVHAGSPYVERNVARSDSAYQSLKASMTAIVSPLPWVAER